MAKLGDGFKDFFYFHPYLGEMIHFDEHIFQGGWNHQLAKRLKLCGITNI